MASVIPNGYSRERVIIIFSRQLSPFKVSNIEDWGNFIKFVSLNLGHTVSELGYTIFGQPFLGSSDNAGFLYVKPTYQVLATSQQYQYIIKRKRLERFSFDLEIKTREENTSNKRTEIERFDWFIERIQKRVAFGERSSETKLHAQELSRNQPILRFDVILQHDWPIEQCLLHIRVFFGRKTKSPCFDFFIHWLVKQITNTYWNHFTRSFENRSMLKEFPLPANALKRCVEVSLEDSRNLSKFKHRKLPPNWVGHKNNRSKH